MSPSPVALARHERNDCPFDCSVFRLNSCSRFFPGCSEASETFVISSRVQIMQTILELLGRRHQNVSSVKLNVYGVIIIISRGGNLLTKV